MEYFLGLDIGTTSVKAVAFDAAGKTLSIHTVLYPIYHPQKDWSEQDPEEIAVALFTTVENILQDLLPSVPRSICFSSAMHSLIAVDKNGKPVSPSIIWADNRANKIAEQIHADKMAGHFYSLTGLPVHAMSPFCKLLWMRRYQPDIFQTAYKFIGIKEFIFFKLFGSYVVDSSIAAATGLMNLETLDWDPSILAYCGTGHEKFSTIVPADQVFSAPALFPQLATVPFVIGASDGAMANLGTADDVSSLVITVGTSSAARIIVEKPYLDPEMRTFCYYIQKDQWLLGGPSNNGGIALQWLQQHFFKSAEQVEIFLNQAMETEPGAKGLLFLPYLLGERAPVWNENAKGVIFGLTIEHGQAEMIRACLEAICYCLYAISQPLFARTEIKNIYASGGLARNAGWLQILADVFDLPVIVSDTIENSAWGAARYGMKTIGVYDKNQPSVKEKFHPSEKNRTVYREGFEKFQRLYHLLKAEF